MQPEKPRRTPRLIDVAEAAGVSRATVAQVLNNSGGPSVRVSRATRMRVLEVARQLRYRPNRIAQQLKGARSRTLGVILDTVNTPVMYQRLAALESEAHRRQHRLIVGQVHGDAAALAGYLQDFNDRGVEGVLCLFDLLRARDEVVIEMLGEQRCAVMHGRALGPHVHCVRVDTRYAIFGLVDHLWARGRRRIALQLWNPDDLLMDLRRQAHADALRAHGASADPRLVRMADAGLERPTSRAVEPLVEDFLAAGADAIVAANDLWAVRFIASLKARGLRVPGDVAVTGYDNLDIAEVVEPSLTTVDQEHAAYARVAVDAIITACSPPAPREYVVTPRVIVRASS